MFLTDVAEKPKVRDLVVTFDGSGEVGKPAKAADAATPTSKSSKSDPCYSYDSQDDQACTSPIQYKFSADEYLALAITPTADIFGKVSEIAKALNKQSSFYEDNKTPREPGSPSSIYSSDQGYSAYLYNSNDTIVVECQPLVEKIIANRDPTTVCIQPSYDDINTTPSTNEAFSGDLPQPNFRFAANFQDDDIVINTGDGCSCRPNFCLAAASQIDDPVVQTSSSSRSTKSIDEADHSFVEMRIPRKSVGSGSSKSSSKSARSDNLAGSLEGRSLDKTVSFSSWATTDIGEVADMGVTNNDSEPNLTKEGLRRRIEAKVRKAPSVVLIPTTLTLHLVIP